MHQKQFADRVGVWIPCLFLLYLRFCIVSARKDGLELQLLLESQRVKQIWSWRTWPPPKFFHNLSCRKLWWCLGMAFWNSSAKTWIPHEVTFFFRHFSFFHYQSHFLYQFLLLEKKIKRYTSYINLSRFLQKIRCKWLCLQSYDIFETHCLRLYAMSYFVSLLIH